MNGVEGEKGTCYRWREKSQCSKGDQCSFRHGSIDRAQKPDHNAATPSEPSFAPGRSVVEEREVSEAKVTMGPFFEHRADIIWKVPRTRSPCEYRQPPECQFFQTETGCKAGEQPKKKLKERLRFSQKKRKRRHECCSYCENCTTIGLRLARLGSIGFSQRKTAPGNPMQKVLGQIRKVRFTQSTLRQASIREKKGPSFGKIQVRNSHQRSPYAKKMRTGFMKRLKDNSDVPEARHGTLQKTYTSSTRTTKLHSTHPRKNGYSRLRQQKSWRKESL